MIKSLEKRQKCYQRKHCNFYGNSVRKLLISMNFLKICKEKIKQAIASRFDNALNEMSDMLAQEGIGIDQDCISKETPLHVAALHGKMEAVWKQIKLPNINVNIKNDEGLTPYQVALRTAENKECPSEKRSRSRDIMELLQGKTTDKIF